MNNKQPCVVIHSTRENGERFRPSDWVDRISATVASFGPDRRLRYAAQVHPKVINGERCLVVNGALADSRPGVYQYILDFARSNHLKMDEDPTCRGASSGACCLPGTKAG